MIIRVRHQKWFMVLHHCTSRRAVFDIVAFMHATDSVNNIVGVSSTSTHRNEPSSMPTNEPVIICHQELIDALDKVLAT